MHELSGFFIFTVYYLWILFQLSTQVDGIFNEGINPVIVDLDIWHQRNARLVAQTNDQLDCEKPASEFYTCEEPLYTVPFEENKTCNYRNQRYHEQVYRWVAGRGCLFYTPDFLYVNGTNTINLNAACVYGNLFAPCLEIAREDGTCGCYPFDPGLEKVANAVREALIPAVQGRWERCFYAAADCCSHYMKGITADESQCEATFDAWTCWQAAEADSIVSEVCSEFAYSNVGPSCNHFSSKQCFPNATWELQTDYSTCSITSRMLRRYRYHIAILSFSIASCLPAIFVFFFYKRLRITRVILHRNLLIAIIVRNILVIVSRSEIYIDELTNSGDTVMSTHGLACRVLAIAERIAANIVFVCMLVEGIFLHSIIVAVFKRKFNLTLLYGLGAVIAIVPVVAWAIVMDMHNDHSCWLVYTVDYVQWILDAPRIAILVINTALFINVLRVLLTKIRNSENAKQLSTAKATLFLMPIFGTQFLLTALRPNTTNCTWEQTYYYFTYAIEGLQGFIVALLYCYVNKEVHALVKVTYKKTENAVMYRVRRLSNAPRPSEGYSDRRMTYSTALPSVDGEYPTNPNAAIINKIHKAEIISLPNSERATVLEPIYETIVVGITNDGYDSTTRSDVDNDSGFIPNRDSKTDEYYAYTNESSVSLEPKDCIRYTAMPTNKLVIKDDGKTEAVLPDDYKSDEIDKKALNQGFDKDVIQAVNQHNTMTHTPESTTEQISEFESNDSDLLEDILQYMEIFENKEVTLDSELLSPNRKDDDKLTFVDF